MCGAQKQDLSASIPQADKHFWSLVGVFVAISIFYKARNYSLKKKKVFKTGSSEDFYLKLFSGVLGEHKVVYKG